MSRLVLLLGLGLVLVSLTTSKQGRLIWGALTQ